MHITFRTAPDAARMVKRARWLALSVVCAFVVGARPSVPAQATVPGDNGKIAFVSEVDGNSHIFTIDADGSELTDLGVGSHPAWSPDGTLIAFQRSQRVFDMTASGDDVTNLSMDRDGDTQPTWSPDGGRIAFIHGGHVWIMRADGSQAHGIASNDVPDSALSWSPDGSEIAVARCCFDDPDLGPYGKVLALTPDGTHQRILFGPKQYHHRDVSVCGIGLHDPDWAPGGDEISFGVNVDGSDGGASEVDYGIIATRERDWFHSQVSEGPVDGSYNSDPGWSPDGSLIAYVSINADLAGCSDKDHETIHVMSSCACYGSDLALTPGWQPAWQPVPVP